MMLSNERSTGLGKGAFLIANLCILTLAITTTADAGLLGGFYTDPNHYQEGSWAGTRMISDLKGDAPSKTITLIGSDDGVAFWTLSGTWLDETRGELTVDFSPKGGPPDLSGTFSCLHRHPSDAAPSSRECRITWQDGNYWSKEEPPKSSNINQC